MKIKKYLYYLTVIFMIFNFVGCSKDEDVNLSEKKILTSFYPMYIMALNLTDGIEEITLENLASPETGCLHDYQLSPSDMIKIQKSDIFLANGAGMESFIQDVINEQEDLNIIFATDDTELLKNEESVNAHSWMDISKYSQEVEYVANELAKFDAKNASQYIENAKIYKQKLKDLQTSIYEKLENVQEKDIIIFHDAFAYFADEFGFQVIAELEVESDSGLSAKEIKELINRVKETGATSIFAEKQYSGKVANTIAEELQIKVYTLDSCVTGELTKDAYLNAMLKNAEIFEEANSF